ncbi:MAG: VF530 family protein [Candidatus Sabulitectum sp.]|nr:VF530 family protein [Candidatus Sabulitectum sp.]
MSEQQINNPLHGITLEKIVTGLVESYGWEELGQLIKIRCFDSNPSVKSSLKFLRKTPWARKKVEDLYLITVKREKRKRRKAEMKRLNKR